MDAMSEFDVVVVGGGPVGENAADRAARTGLSVALVEAELVGGECSYWACMPSKTLLRAGAVLAAAAAVPGLAGQVEGMSVDPSRTFAWRDEMTGGWDDAGQEAWLESTGITLVRGHGRLAGDRLVEVDPPDDPSKEPTGPRTLRARHAVVLATGSVPVLPDVPGIATALPWGSREATSASAVPESLVIVGGGVVGTEMATAYADLGSHVTLLARGGLLSSAEPFAGEAVAAELRTLGVDVCLGTTVRSVDRPVAGGPVMVRFGGGSSYGAAHDDAAPGLAASRGASDDAATDGRPAAYAARTVTAAEILVATGRVARTADLGVETVGLEPGQPFTVDDTMAVVGLPSRPSPPWLYACGDVAGRGQTTHQGKYQGRVAGDVIAARFGDATREDAPTHGESPPLPGREPRPWSRYAATADGVAAPQVVFTRPQVAWVGLTERAARQRGLTVRAVRYALGDVAGATVSAVGYQGTGQLVVDARRRVVVGATFVGPEVGELLHAATIAVVGQVPVDRLWHAVPAYPTVSEVWLRLLEAYGL